jgi:5-methylcytosine-specific restriction endonuclease McrA
VPFNIMTFHWVARPLTRAEAKRVLERDQFCCRYCGLDGRASFENALVMGVDFVIPRAKKGHKSEPNLVACCRPCNTLKGHHVFKSFDEAKTYVLKRREELRKTWESTETKERAETA